MGRVCFWFMMDRPIWVIFFMIFIMEKVFIFILMESAMKENLSKDRRQAMERCSI
jgi:hypothetical protein